MNKIIILSDKYSQTMKTLNTSLQTSFFDLTEELKTCIDSICRFENLTQLELDFINFEGIQPIDDCLSLIGQKCNKLLKLDLSIFSSDPITDRFFDALSEFEVIKKLKIYLENSTELNGSIESLKQCKQLKHLDINYTKLREDFFANIASFVPKLQTLRIETEKPFSDSFINSLHSMKFIQKVSLFVDNLNDIDYTYPSKFWYFGKCLSDVMSSPKANDVIRVTDKCELVSIDETIRLAMWCDS